MRSGIAAASSARQKQSSTPIAVITTNSGIENPPSACTAKPTSPITSIVPARPMTKAPHQFVSLASSPDLLTSPVPNVDVSSLIPNPHWCGTGKPPGTAVSLIVGFNARVKCFLCGNM